MAGWRPQIGELHENTSDTRACSRERFRERSHHRPSWQLPPARSKLIVNGQPDREHGGGATKGTRIATGVVTPAAAAYERLYLMKLRRYLRCIRGNVSVKSAPWSSTLAASRLPLMRRASCRLIVRPSPTPGALLRRLV